MKVLVCNAGSTSLKFKLFDMPAEEVLATGKIERVGSDDNAIFHYQAKDGYTVELEKQCIPTYTIGIQKFLDCLMHPEHAMIDSLEELERVGFKTVLSKDHYGVHELTPEVLQGMEDYMVIAPAHNAPYLAAIRQFQELTPDAKLVGVYETAFHRTIPRERYIYGIPYEWYEKYGIRRFGYHGASHEYIAETIAEKYGTTGKTISCHLGGSCSLCAIDEGKSVDTSFGISLQVGINNSNRCGDIDPFIIPFLQKEGMDLDDVLYGLTKNGGLLGISGVSNDLRLVEEAADAGNDRAKLAVDIFVNDIIKYIGAYTAELGGLDHLVFTAGIGEHDAYIRERVCSRLSHLGIWMDEEKNKAVGNEAATISKDDSPVTIEVVPANEELGVARKTYRL